METNTNPERMTLEKAINNALSLFRSESSWEFLHLADTRNGINIIE